MKSKPFSLPLGIVVNDLHYIYLGVTKSLLGLWFGTKLKSAEYCLGKKVNITTIPDYTLII